MAALTYRLRLIEPVLAAQAQSGDANSATAALFVPGSLVRGALIARLYPQGLTPTDPTVRSLFFTGSVCYLNAYLAHPSDGSRMLPKPLSWFVPKDHAKRRDAVIHDFAIQDPQWNEPTKAPAGGDYVAVKAGYAQLGNPRLSVMVHNASTQRDVKRGDDSLVFRYEALAPGEELIGVIVSDDVAALQRLKPHLAGEFRLGGSQSAGYGRVEVELVSPKVETEWAEYSPIASSVDPTASAVLTCLSDVILRDGLAPGAEAISALVGQAPHAAFYHLHLVGGFNRRWGLPLPQSWAITAGSVFVFPAGARQTLQRFVQTGVGERRVEGFGRVALDWHSQPTLSQSELPPRALAVRPPEGLSTVSQTVARRMATRILQAEVDRALVAEVNRLTAEGRLSGLPSAAQLSRARLAARQAWVTGNLAPILDHFTRETRDEAGMSRLTVRAWERARIGDEGLWQWITERAKKQTYTPRDARAMALDAVEIAGQRVEYTELRPRTVARLIEGVLKRAVKQAKRRAEGEDHV